ncbi:MAG TPA: SGNH/GDSL hydrolase family protein [Polyangia bacterium]|nr:SGNH/GDSL hydrolase family protein [Polyangia bacterium]
MSERRVMGGWMVAAAIVLVVSAGSCAARDENAAPPQRPAPMVTLPPVPSAAAAPPGPGPSAPPTGTVPVSAEQRLEEWRRARTRVYMNDFGELARYRAANAHLGAPAPNESRVVFFGDSITDQWPLPLSFPGKTTYINRGINGQTTPQMLVRFRQDVVALQPKVVVILAGTNDIAGNTGPMTIDETMANFAEMVELARLHGIRVVLSSVLPVHDYTAQSALSFPLRPPEKIAELNQELKRLAARTGSVYLDYTPFMSDGRGYMKRDLAIDGLHPNSAGYAIMAPLAEAAIASALASR